MEFSVALTEEAQSLADIIARGGPVMYPLAACSVPALAVFFERLWSLRKARIIPEGLTSKVIDFVSAGNIEAATRECERRSRSPLARVALAGLTHLGDDRETIRFIVSEVGGQEAAGLERFQRILSTVAHIAPLLGLLGTVSGMIKAFSAISKHSIGDPALVAGGISEALITTAAGLVVAIPVVVMHKVVQSAAAGRSLELEREAVKLTECFMKAAVASSGEESPLRNVSRDTGERERPDDPPTAAHAPARV